MTATQTDPELELLEALDAKIKMLLAGMDVPPLRIEFLTIPNLGWLERNLMVRNSNHPHFTTVSKDIIELKKGILKRAKLENQ